MNIITTKRKITKLLNTFYFSFETDFAQVKNKFLTLGSSYSRCKGTQRATAVLSLFGGIVERLQTIVDNLEIPIVYSLYETLFSARIPLTSLSC